MAFGQLRLRKVSGADVSAEPSTGPGDRVYAIGDIHGRYDLLLDLMAQIEAHNRARAPAESLHIVVLGDMIDRGPDSAETLRFLHDIQTRSTRLITLRGNHEDMMLRALSGEPGLMRAWMKTGGRATLRSFGVTPPSQDDEIAAARDAFASSLPRALYKWVNELPLTAQSGDYLFCHAGIRPGVPLKMQAHKDLLWIREDFLPDERDHGFVVVHGHSVSAEVEERSNRIGIDTGAYRTGVLTALFLEGVEREIITARE